jgi:signal transduction histidine kinase
MDGIFQDFLNQVQSLPPAAMVMIAIVGLACLAIGGFLGYYQQRLTKKEPGEKSSRGKGKWGSWIVGQSDRDRLNAIYTMTSTLSSTLNYQRVLDNALDLSTTALADPNHPADHVVSAVLLFQDDELFVGSARRFTRPDMRAKLPGNSGLIGRTIHQVYPIVVQSLADDPELARIIALRACNSAYCFPLRAGIDVYGVLLFSHPDPDYFTEDRREILEIIGRQAMIAIQNARLYQDLELEKEKMMDIQEEARKKLARDLHDGPTQSVAAIAMRINFARRLMERNRQATVDELYKIENLARQTTKEIRHMLFTLRPLILESQGLAAALESMAEKMRETYGQNVIVEANPEVVDLLEMGKQAVIFYIAEEAVNNARKHAQASEIKVRIKGAGSEVALLEIEDDGVGFNVGEVDASYEQRGSLGMVNMRERAELINGVLNISSTEGKGTLIKIWIPLTEEASDRIRYGA